MHRIVHIAGARPNFMKLAPILKELAAYPDIESILIHTGQHYDDRLSKEIFEDLKLPEPNIYLEVGSGSHAEQCGKILMALEPQLIQLKPDMLLVVGDVNSTLAAALCAAKLNIPIAHVEAGLRSFDNSMPEEINRILTDAISDLLLTSSPEAQDNLLKEGRPKESIHFVGNVMIDTLMAYQEQARSLDHLKSLHLSPEEFVLVTLHRPSNVDDATSLKHIMQALEEVSNVLPVIFPVHPRTQAKLEAHRPNDRMRLLPPLRYLEFLNLMQHAALVITDSGGIQEETTVLNIPCITLRPNTERPITITHGTNQLVDPHAPDIAKHCIQAIKQPKPSQPLPPLWDGQAAKRLTNVLQHSLKERS